MRFLTVLLFVLALNSQTTEFPTGRWEGQIQMPDGPMRLVIDLAQDGAGQWKGSAIVPGFDIKGSPLSEITAAGQTIAFTAKEIFGGSNFKAQLTAENRLTGTYTQGGNTAPFTLQRAGTAQVEEAPHSTAIRKATEGIWVGEMTLFDHPVSVRLTLKNGPAGIAAAQMLLKGRRENLLTMDVITEEEGILSVSLPASSIAYEGRINDQSGTIAGTFTDGPYEAPLNLRRGE